MSIKQNIILTINNLHNLPKYLNIRNELVHERFQISLTIKPLENLTKMQLWTIKYGASITKHSKTTNSR